jgi:hypothetical protein
MVWAKGDIIDGQPYGYWERFRKDGLKCGLATITCSKQVGEWTIYDKAGKVYKVTGRSKEGAK